MTEANDNFPTRRALRERMRGSDAPQTSRESRPAAEQSETVSTNTSALPAPLHPDGRPMTRREAREWRARQDRNGGQQAAAPAQQPESAGADAQPAAEAQPVHDAPPEAVPAQHVSAPAAPETRQAEAPEGERDENEASAPNSSLASMVRESHLKAAESGENNAESTETAIHQQQPGEAGRWSRPVEEPSASEPEQSRTAERAEEREHAEEQHVAEAGRESDSSGEVTQPDEAVAGAEPQHVEPQHAAEEKASAEAQSATEIVDVQDAESVVPEHDEQDAEPVPHRGTWRSAEEEARPQHAEEEPAPQRAEKADFRDDYHKPSTIVVPEVPENAHLGSPLNSTGEVILTGSVALPRNLSSTGQHSRVDTAEVDRDEDAAFNVTGENEPVRAADAVSSHASTRAVVAPRKSSSSNWPLIAAVGASVAGVGVVVLILGFVFHWFN